MSTGNYKYSSSLNIPNAPSDFLRIILNGFMVCRYVCETNLNYPLYSFFRHSSPLWMGCLEGGGVQETALFALSLCSPASSLTKKHLTRESPCL